MEERTVTITLEEYKDLLETKILFQNAERAIQKDKYFNKDDFMELLGIEQDETGRLYEENDKLKTQNAMLRCKLAGYESKDALAVAAEDVDKQ